VLVFVRVGRDALRQEGREILCSVLVSKQEARCRECISARRRRVGSCHVVSVEVTSCLPIASTDSLAGPGQELAGALPGAAGSPSDRAHSVRAIVGARSVSRAGSPTAVAWRQTQRLNTRQRIETP